MGCVRTKMTTCALLAAVCVLAGPRPKKPKPLMPDRFLIGRRTFFDFGPPFEFFEIISVRTTGGGTLVERIQVTPPGLSRLAISVEQQRQDWWFSPLCAAKVY